MHAPGRCRDQAAARSWVRALLAAAGFRSDRAACWEAILLRCIGSMDWQTGLVTALTHAEMAASAGCSERTVSRTIAWAIGHGLVVIAEQPASKEFLKSTRGRTPTYAFYRPPALDDQDGAPEGSEGGPAPTSTSLSCTNNVLGDLPRSTGGSYPSQAQGMEKARPPGGLNTRSDERMPTHLNRSSSVLGALGARRWPLWLIPATPAEREQALDRVLQRVGVDPGGLPHRTRWALRGLLARWWDAGLAPAALLHALGHHPDRPGRPHGPLTDGARDLAAVAGARLRPWTGRLGELPAEVVGHHAAAVQAALRAPAQHAVRPDLVRTDEVGREVLAAPDPGPADERDAGPLEGEALRAQLRARFAAEQAGRRAARDVPDGGRGTHPQGSSPRRRARDARRLRRR